MQQASRELLVTLVSEEQEDGCILVSCPQLPLFHLIAPSESKVLDVALPVLKETIERAFGGTVKLRRIEELASAGDLRSEERIVPAHMIADMCA